MNPPTPRHYTPATRRVRYPILAAALATATTTAIAWLSPLTNGATPTRTDHGVVNYQPNPTAPNPTPVFATFERSDARTATLTTASLFALELNEYREPDADDITPERLPPWSSARDHLTRQRPLPPGIGTRTIRQEAHGWPARALLATLTIDHTAAHDPLKPPQPATVTLSGALSFDATFTTNRPPTPPTRETLIPLAPLWPGFIANTAAFALPIYIALVAPRALRDRNRRTHARCRRCNYQLDDLDRCPECNTQA